MSEPRAKRAAGERAHAVKPRGSSGERNAPHSTGAGGLQATGGALAGADAAACRRVGLADYPTRTY